MLESLVQTSHLYILLVADTHTHSTVDVFNGYEQAFNDMQIPFDTFKTHEYLKFYSKDTVMALLMTKILMLSSEQKTVTHVLFVCGLDIPPYVYRSKYDKKFYIIATDDPHSSQPILDISEHLDGWFTNERECLGKSKCPSFYVQTATTNHIPSSAMYEMPEEYQSEFCFIGSVYPNRVKMLETVCSMCKERGLKVIIRGFLQFVHKDSIIHEYAKHGIVSNEDKWKYYSGTKFIINAHRDINWYPFKETNERLVKVDAYDTNPRTFEAGLIRRVMLCDRDRQAVMDCYGDTVVYYDENDATEAIERCLNMSDDEYIIRVQDAFRRTLNSHTYVHRAKSILEVIDKAV